MAGSQEVVVPKMAVAGFGYFAVCLDAENNCFALYKTDKSAEKKRPAAKHGETVA